MPPADALTAILRAHHDFVIDDQPGHRRPTTRLANLGTPSGIPGAVLVLIDANRTAPEQVVSRADLNRAAVEVGVPVGIVSTYLSYHEAFVKLAGPDACGLWSAFRSDPPGRGSGPNGQPPAPHAARKSRLQADSVSRQRVPPR